MRPELAALIGAERFLKEIETTANLQHPHILPLFDSGRGRRHGVLRHALRRGRIAPRPARRARRSSPSTTRSGSPREVADGARLRPPPWRDPPRHQAGQRAVPRRPGAGGRLRHRAGLEPGATASRLTQAGVSLGTPQYMSPEQAAGERDARLRGPTSTPSAWCCTRCWPAEPPFTGPTAQADPRAGDRGGAPPGHRAAQDRFPPRRRRRRARAREASGRPLADRRRVRRGARDADVGAHGEPRAMPAARRRAAIPGLSAAGSRVLALGWVGLRTAAGARAVRRADPVQRRARPGSRAHLHARSSRLSPDGRQLFVTGDGRPPGGGAAPSVRSAADGSDRRRRAGRPGDRKQPPVRLAGRTLDRLRQAGKAVEGPGGRRARHRSGAVPTGPAAVGAGTVGWSTPRPTTPGLWIVSEAGGDERMLTTPDTAKGELGHWWPQILPDGDHVIFTAYRTPIERATIEVLSIRTGERKVLLTGGVYGFYVPTGHLLYAAGEAIRAVPFDLDRLAVTGTAVPVVDSVAMNPRTAPPPSTSRRTGRWRTCRSAPTSPRRDLVLVDRQRRRDPGPSRQRSLQSPAPLARRAPHRGRHPLGQLAWGTSGCSRSGARAGPASPRKAGGTSAPSGRPTGGS